MALPKKNTKIDFRHAHERRSLPALLEQYLTDNDYVLRAMSAASQWAVAAQAELIYPLRKEDLEESAPEEAKELCHDIAMSNYSLQPDGTFQRGDVRLYVQSRAARDAVREARLMERTMRLSEEHVHDKIDEMNKQLNEEARGMAKVAPGLHGSGHIPEVSDHASGGVAELNRTRDLAEAMAGQTEE